MHADSQACNHPSRNRNTLKNLGRHSLKRQRNCYVVRVRASKRETRRVRYRLDRANKVAAEKGLTSQLERAAFFGVTNQNLSRVERGDVWPGEAFIASVLSSHPDEPWCTFDYLFEVV